MASRSLREHLLVLLRDAEELDQAHRRLRTGGVGRQWGLGSLNRSVVVACVSAWEAYLESVVLEVLESARPPDAPGMWSSWSASVRSAVGRFNNPTPDNVANLFRDALGLQNIRLSWEWRNCTAAQAEARLAEALRYRHEVAHGVNPRPTVHNNYSKRLPGFFRRLGECTDRAVAVHADIALGVALAW